MRPYDSYTHSSAIDESKKSITFEKLSKKPILAKVEVAPDGYEVRDAILKHIKPSNHFECFEIGVPIVEVDGVKRNHMILRDQYGEILNLFSLIDGEFIQCNINWAKMMGVV
jgi:hypothetical protein